MGRESGRKTGRVVLIAGAGFSLAFSSYMPLLSELAPTVRAAVESVRPVEDLSIPPHFLEEHTQQL